MHTYTIRRIVRMRQMLLRWRNKAAHHRSHVPRDVPSGHVAVCVGSGCRRFVVPATHLNHPVFRGLLFQAEEEYGFDNRTGPLLLPCDEYVFERMLRAVDDQEELRRCCHVGESGPLLKDFVDESVF